MWPPMAPHTPITMVEENNSRVERLEQTLGGGFYVPVTRLRTKTRGPEREARPTYYT